MLSTFLCALRSKEELLTQAAPAQGGKAAIEGAPHILGGIEPLAI